ncbi:MAG: hypothetical protein ACF8R7_12900, partial [Phycisphaerales bacterium JB039]
MSERSGEQRHVTPALRLAPEDLEVDRTTPPRVLAAFCPAPVRARLKRSLARAVETLDFAGAQRELEIALSEGSYDVVLIGDEIDSAVRTLIIERLGAAGEISPVALTSRATLEDALDAMRAGAADIIEDGASQAELATRLAQATAR